MRPLLNLSSKRPKEPTLSSHTFKSNLKCCNFCIWFSNLIKIVGKFALSLLVCVIKFQINLSYIDLLGANRSSQVQFEFTKLHWDGCNFGGLYLFHQMLVFNKIYWMTFPLKSSYCGKISCQSKLFWMFGSNSKFKITTFLDYSELQRLITSSYKVCFFFNYWKSCAY